MLCTCRSFKEYPHAPDRVVVPAAGRGRLRQYHPAGCPRTCRRRHCRHSGTLDAAACRQAGGALTPLGRLQRVQCVVPYADAGKACSAKADCTGQCLAQGEVAPGAKAQGLCQVDISQNFGCRQRIDGGVALGTICVD